MDVIFFSLSIHFICVANTNPNDVQSTLSSDGVLTITASRQSIQQDTERVVPITQTGATSKPAECASASAAPAPAAPAAAAAATTPDSAAPKVE